MENGLKILIEMKHGLGDCIHVLPMLEILRTKYHNAYIAMIVNSEINKELIELSGIKVDKFYFLSIKNRPLLETLKLILELRRECFDYGILATMTPKQKGKIFFNLLNIKNKLGEQFNGIDFFDLDNSIHFVDRNIDIIRNLCPYEKNNIIPKLNVSSNIVDSYRKIFRKKNVIVGICIGNGDASLYKGKRVYTRGWGIENIRKLILSLIDYDIEVVLFGGKQEKNLLISLTDVLLSSKVFNFVGETSITESVALAKLCTVVVGCDTGMQHIAAAAGVATISLFGPTNFRTHGAYASNAYFIEVEQRLECQYCFTTKHYLECENRKCMSGIKVDKVLSEIIKKCNLHKG